MRAAVLATFLVSLGAHAQGVHKCVVDGQVSYQTAPCAAGDAGVVVKTPEAFKARPPTERERSQCDVAMRYRLKDYDSAKFEREPVVLGVLPLGATVTVEGKRYTEGLVVSYWVNAKNSYGGYTGLKPMMCYLALDGSGAIEVR